MSCFWKRAEQFPPVLVRILARHPYGPPLSDHDIAIGANNDITPHQVRYISHCTSWYYGIDLRAMQRFLRGCRCDFDDGTSLKRMIMTMRRPCKSRFDYLRESDEWETLFKPLTQILGANPEILRPWTTTKSTSR